MNKKLKILLITVPIVAVVLALISLWGFVSLRNDGVQSVMTGAVSSVKMSNGFIVAFPDTLTPTKASEYVTDLKPQYGSYMIEVSYNSFTDGQSRNVAEWKKEIAALAQEKSGMDIATSSLTGSTINNVQTLKFNEVKSDTFVSQVIVPVLSSNNTKFIQFTLSSSKTDFATGQNDLSRVVTYTIDQYVK